MSNIIFHVDVNSAYLSWEAVHRLQMGEEVDLRQIPSVVGGNEKSRHGIVLAKSIPAKKYNIQTGETLFSARLKCPELVVAPPRYHLYMKCSQEMEKLLNRYSPNVQFYSIDEMFLDYTNMEKHFGDPVSAAHSIKNRIKEELGFTVNVGIGPNKLLAKMASDLKKPDRVHTLFHEEMAAKMWPLSVDKLFMVGSRTAKKLKAKGINTIGDLAITDRSKLYSMLKSHGVLIHNYANGIENSKVRNDLMPVKGLGNSSTFAFDVCSEKEALMLLLSLTETVTARLRRGDFRAKVIKIHIKDKDFYSFSHQRKVATAISSTDAIYKVVKELFLEIWHKKPIRKMGVALSDIYTSDCEQLSFWAEEDESKRELDKTIDNIRMRYGSKAVFRSCFLHSGIKPLEGGVIDSEDYPMVSSIL
ncbi:DNA polymerase IV [Proteinivorax hydrogeniformans]|uniref:DNA polymerase IV n=1 Tax=Proteinivorax hydrogeniformans TaxID=1826727 RepID=A0AAU8HWZ2_9FIRM